MSAVRRNFNEVRSGGMEQLQQLFPPLAGGFGKRLAHPTASGIQEQSFTGLCIFQLEESHIRNLFLTRVGNADGYQVVMPSGAFERPFETPVEKIAEQKDNSPPVQNPVQIVQSFSQDRTAVHRLKEKNIADETKHVPGTFSGR